MSTGKALFRYTIDPNSPVPLYYQIRENLKELIRSKELLPGEVIPPERELSESYNVNRLTVRQAISELVSEGLLRRQRGVGTFVSQRDSSPILPDLTGFPQLTGFTERMLRQGRTPTSRLLSLATQAPPRSVAQALNLTIDSEIVKIVRLRLADEEPIMMETSYILSQFVPGLQESHLRADHSLYHLLNTRYDIRAAEADEVLEPVVLTAYEAEILGVEPGRPALLVEGTVYQANHKPLEFTKSLIRGDKARFYFHLRRTGQNDPTIT
jgi:GntR family transcriptional regulator